MQAVLDDWDAFHPFSKVCSLCLHKYQTARRTCKAFPDGIPKPIWLGEHDHKTPYPDDNGIRYAPRPSGQRF